MTNKFLILFIFLITTQSFAQTSNSAKTVDQFPIYPGCENSFDDLQNCFDNNLKDDINNKLSKIRLDKILKSTGTFFAKLYFIVDEEGNFTDIKVSGNDVLGRISKEILLKINAEQIENNKKIEPAKLAGNSVKMNYSFPIEYKVQ